jgi:hypothetical protein
MRALMVNVLIPQLKETLPQHRMFFKSSLEVQLLTLLAKLLQLPYQPIPLPLLHHGMIFQQRTEALFSINGGTPQQIVLTPQQTSLMFWEMLQPSES